MFIANICFKRSGREIVKPFGSIWYGQDTHHAAILLKGFRFGQFFAKPFVDNAPYLEGDIEVFTGDYVSVGKKEYLWCGWIWTESDQRGPIYNGVLEVEPLISIVREMAIDDAAIKGKRKGIMVNINLVDKE